VYQHYRLHLIWGFKVQGWLDRKRMLRPSIVKILAP
jgi:hypothetical protein